jgi:hypothetical protein
MINPRFCRGLLLFRQVIETPRCHLVGRLNSYSAFLDRLILLTSGECTPCLGPVDICLATPSFRYGLPESSGRGGHPCDLDVGMAGVVAWRGLRKTLIS